MTLRDSFIKNLGKDIRKNTLLYLLIVPVIAYYLIFNYAPMYGVIVAFMDYKPRLGFSGSAWVGLKHLKIFFDSVFFTRLVSNTFLLSFYGLIFGFPIPVIFAILLNEIHAVRFKKVIQTVTYLPNFITTVVICSIVLSITNSEGFITRIVNGLTGSTGSLIGDSSNFRTIYVASGIWQGFGWGSIVYLAAISGVNPELYESAIIDGANKFRRIWHVTMPGILPTVIITLILSIGGMMNVGWEKAFLLQSPVTYETSDIISTYVYRKGFEEMNYSFSAAVNLFNSFINIILLVSANLLSRRITEGSLW